MSRHGTESNPVTSIARWLAKYTRDAGQKPNVVRHRRGISLSRSAWRLLRQVGVRVEVFGGCAFLLLALLAAALIACPAPAADELVKPPPATCEGLWADAEAEIKGCERMCPDRSPGCAADSCVRKYIDRYIEALPACPAHRLYHPVPKWLQGNLIVE